MKIIEGFLSKIGFFRCFICGRLVLIKGTLSWHTEYACRRITCQRICEIKNSLLPKQPDYEDERISKSWDEILEDARRPEGPLVNIP